jgi:hypothetical protein
MVNKLTSVLSRKHYFLGLLFVTVITACTVDLNTLVPKHTSDNWSCIYGGMEADVASKIVYLPGQGAAVIGSTKSFRLRRDHMEDSLMVLRLDENGNRNWGQVFGTFDFDFTDDIENRGLAICALATGGFALTGTTESCGDPSRGDIFIAKLNRDGTCAWQKSLGTTTYTETPCFIKETKKGILIGATWNEYRYTENKFYSWFTLIKLGKDGSLLWEKKYQRTFDILTAFDVTDDEYILAGQTYNSSYDLFLIKIKGENAGTDEGAVEWQKQIARTGRDQANTVLRLADGYIIGGYTTVKRDTTSDDDGWLIRLDTAGEKVWELIIGDGEEGNIIDEEIYGIQEITAGAASTQGFMLLGNVATVDGYDTWLARLSTNGNILWQKKYGEIENDWGVDMVKKDGTHFLVAGFTANAPNYGFAGGEFWVFNVDADGNSDQPNVVYNISNRFIRDNSTIFSIPNPLFAPTVENIPLVDIDKKFEVLWSDPTSLSIARIPWATPTPTVSPTP